MSDFIIEIRAAYRTTHNKCCSGAMAIKPDSIRNLPGADGRIRDVWTAVADLARDAKDVLDIPTDLPAARQLKAQLEEELSFIAQSFEYYR